LIAVTNSAPDPTVSMTALTSATGNALPARAGASEVQLLASIAGITNVGIAQPIMMSEPAVAMSNSASAWMISDR
jgi:hypothetical protein